jgi:acetolactate synthase-1/2/3 large subunit
MPQMTGSQALVRSLAREGVETLFTLPGAQIMGIFDALYEHSEIRVIAVRHEQTTTFMADGYARVRGKPGVALVVPGPGVQNASAGLSTAYSASSPVLLLAGQIQSAMIGKDKGALHEINDQLDLVRPVTKWCRRVLSVRDIPGAVHEAFRQMKTGRPRPTEVEIPPDVLASSAQVELLEREDCPRLASDRRLVSQAAELLHAAKKPLIWAGGGVILSDAGKELTALAERLGAPVATTAEGKGSIPEDHPLALGASYHGMGGPAGAAPRADILLAVGTRFNRQMAGATKPRPDQRLVHIDADPEVIGRNFPAEIAIAADAKIALTDLLKEMAEREAPEPRWTDAELRKIREDSRRQVEQLAPAQCEIIAQIRKALDDDAILVSGVTNVGYWSHFAYQARKPRTYLTASYAATLGFAFPTALGAKIAAPGRTVVSLSGDGGYMYALPELATAVQHGIHVIALVFVDNAFGALLNEQRTRYQERVIGTELHNPSFARLAELFGARGIKAEPDRLQAALQEAQESPRPTVIEVPIPTRTPPFQA